MSSMNRHAFIAVLMIPFSGCSAESSKQTSEPVVINVDNAKKKSVSDYFSPLRYGTTQIFYSFVKENTVLHVELKNTDTSFPISARVVRFQDGSDEEQMNKWISNNYSDALYTVEKPILDKTLAPSCCSIRSSKESGREVSQSTGVTHKVYDVEFTLETQMESGQFVLEGFTDSAKVYILESTSQK